MSVTMFEITGHDIGNLGDDDLRSLVARLAVAELKERGHPISSVTAGGDQDAPDGGIDVRVECPSDIPNPDFVPRRQTGFQVKRPDMPPSAILAEMRPNGVLREAICKLANVSGAYVIVSAQGSVADRPLSDRRQAMRGALNDLPSAPQLHVDFYDRDRLATWANLYPGTVAWVRSKSGRPIAGWSNIENWDGGGGSASKPYLADDRACLIDESSRGHEQLAIVKGIERLREKLSRPAQCIRLIGLSGVGKTRLVQALFEKDVGGEPLDSNLAIYTDYSEEPVPIARDMARQLIGSGQRAILIVDNCNPATHSELARLCSNDVSKVSLITVEYDVGGDEHEDTDVFRLQSASSELLTAWIKREFPNISEIDRTRIADFSGGNFRVAKAIAKTLGRGETLGKLQDRDLFERIFQQRNETDQQLIRAAEDLSLLYSVDGVDVSAEGELARVGALRGVYPNVLYEKLFEMQRRGVVQARGRFRAVLPQAIANPLAARALRQIPPDRFDQVCHAMSPRMIKSLARRLGFLHDSEIAQEVVTRWLREDGPLGNLMAAGYEGREVIRHIAPVAPGAVLAKLARELDVSNVSYRAGDGEWIQLIKTIGYDADLFERAVMLLARFIRAKSGNEDHSSSSGAFRECFHIYLSGTQATPERRRAVIRQMAASQDSHLQYCAVVAMRELLQSRHFTSLGNYDFGARSRDWGWVPKSNEDVSLWFEEAINLIVELAPDADARGLLASGLRGLWRYPGCRPAIDRAATAFLQKSPWIEGWIACRSTLRFDGKTMLEAERCLLEQLADRLKPADLLNQARAVVLNRMSGGSGLDFSDGEDDEGDPIKAWQKAEALAVELGRAFAKDEAVRAEFVAELLVRQVQRAFEFGRGLAEGADNLNDIWSELVSAYGVAAQTSRRPVTLGGFLQGAHHRDHSFASGALESAIASSDLLPVLPYLQASVGLDIEGVLRLRRAIAGGNISATDFHYIANGSVLKSPQEPLAELLEDLAGLPNGPEVALDILSMRFHSQGQDGDADHSARLVSVGRNLLTRVEYGSDNSPRDYAAYIVIKACLIGEDGREAAEKLCANIHLALESYRVSPHELQYTLKSLIEAQPLTVLDGLLLPGGRTDLFEDSSSEISPLETLTPAILQEWADRDPNMRYPLLVNWLSMFSRIGDEEKGLSPLFLSMLEQAPDKKVFLGDLSDRLPPRSWSGSRADIVLQRKTKLMELAEHANQQVRFALTEAMVSVDSWIEHEREIERARDRADEERFE